MGCVNPGSSTLDFVWCDVSTDDSRLASLLAVCDKIAIRGNPTLADLEFERSLLTGPLAELFDCEEQPEAPDIGLRFNPETYRDNVSEIVAAAYELCELPCQSAFASHMLNQDLPTQLRACVSAEEDIFDAKLREHCPANLINRIHRQAPIRDLVHERISEGVDYGYVDFAIQTQFLRVVIEIDGEQHAEPGQRGLDEQRDALLRKNGWRVWRLSAASVHMVDREWLEANVFGALAQPMPCGYDSIADAVQRSRAHALAYHAILIPLATHQCLRGLVQLFLHGIVHPDSMERVVFLEEDLPVVSEAWRQLQSLWTRIHAIAPDTPPAPSFSARIVGAEEMAEGGSRSTQSPAHAGIPFDRRARHFVWIPVAARISRASRTANIRGIRTACGPDAQGAWRQG